MLNFPSIEWFAALRDLVNKDERYHKLGTCETRAGFQVGNRCFELVLDAFQVGDIRELKPAEADQSADFVLEMDEAGWKEMLASIVANGGADADHTLNTLVFPGRMKLRYRDSFGMDKFYLYNQSLQYLVNSAARLPGRVSA